MNRVYITDKELAAILEVSPKTISRIIHGFVRGGDGLQKTCASVYRKLIDAKPESFGGYRRWKISNVASALGVTEDEIVRRIS